MREQISYIIPYNVRELFCNTKVTGSSCKDIRSRKGIA